MSHYYSVISLANTARSTSDKIKEGGSGADVSALKASLREALDNLTKAVESAKQAEQKEGN